jgi:hypothetical protein
VRPLYHVPQQLALPWVFISSTGSSILIDHKGDTAAVHEERLNSRALQESSLPPA